MDWIEFLQSDNFRQYRKKQIELVGAYLASELESNLLAGIDSSLKTAAALKMARILLRLPERLTEDDKTIKNLKNDMSHDIAELTGYLFKRMIMEE